MAVNENNFKETVNSLFKGMDSFVSAKTVVGDAIHVGNTIILPLVDVSFGVGAGAFSSDNKNNGGGGLGGKMTPCAVLVIQDGNTKLVNIKNQDGLTKVLDMVPDFVNRFSVETALQPKERILLTIAKQMGQKRRIRQNNRCLSYLFLHIVY